mgnify:CR=1 FL=1
MKLSYCDSGRLAPKAKSCDYSIVSNGADYFLRNKLRIPIWSCVPIAALLSEVEIVDTAFLIQNLFIIFSIISDWIFKAFIFMIIALIYHFRA